jgi:hypothetical protein
MCVLQAVRLCEKLSGCVLGGRVCRCFKVEPSAVWFKVFPRFVHCFVEAVSGCAKQCVQGER